MSNYVKVDASKWGKGEWFPDVEETEPVKLRGVYLKLAEDRWVLTQRPPARKSRYSDIMWRQGRQPSGALVILIQAVPETVTDADLCVLANQTALVGHLGKVNEDAFCCYHFGQLGIGKVAR